MFNPISIFLLYIKQYEVPLCTDFDYPNIYNSSRKDKTQDHSNRQFDTNGNCGASRMVTRWQQETCTVIGIIPCQAQKILLANQLQKLSKSVFCITE